MVKCTECGYLAIRNKHNYKLEEAVEEYRQKGILPMLYDEIGHNQHHIHDIRPFCFVQSYDLGNEVHLEFGNLEGSISKDELGCVMAVVQKSERDCDKKGLFTGWKPGFTPKEHREMLDRQWMIERDEKRDADLRAWQSAESKKNRHWRKWEFIVAIIAIILIVIAAFIERGGQPTIQIITPEVPEINIIEQP